MKGAFITGSDTEVGKTFVLAAICRYAIQQGKKFIVRKPVESGTFSMPTGTTDSKILFEACNRQEPIETICPFSFFHALAPPDAARKENQSLYLADLVKSVGTHEQPVLVEGAGGFLSPIAEDALNADLAKKLELPILLVVEFRLGWINQALLSIEAILQRNLQCLGVVLNTVHANKHSIPTTTPWCQFPIFHIPHQANSIPHLDEIKKIYSCIFNTN